MKILITGSTGFVGQHVLKALLPLDHEIVATVSDIRRIGREYSNHNVRFVSFNLDKFDGHANYFEAFGRPDLLIHLAWQGLPNYKSLFHFEHNLPVHYHFLKNMITNGLNDLAVTGTCFEYGMKEGCLSEDMCADPGNSYALAKDSLRKFLVDLQKNAPFNFKWIRLFYMYGTGQNANSLLSQLQKALDMGEETFNMSGGEQLRDYLPVERVADYIVKIALQKQFQGIINCCSGIPVTIKKLAEEFVEKSGKTIKLNLGHYPYSDYEPMNFWGDTGKLKNIIIND